MVHMYQHSEPKQVNLVHTGQNCSTYVIKEGQRKLEAAGKESSAFDARALLSFVTGVPFRDMPLNYADEVTEEQQAQYEQLLERRISGEPLQYITGEQEFMGLTFHVDPRVLIPRLDTEILAEEAVVYVRGRLYGQETDLYTDQNLFCHVEQASLREQEMFHILDLCCGSGAIGLSVAALAGGMKDGSPALVVTLSDISEDALDVARQNAEALGVLDRVSFIRSDLFEAFSERGDFDLIVCNPPYVRSDVIPTLDEEVRGHEPVLALDGGADGLDIYRRIAKEAPEYLKPGGRLMMEIGFDQGDAVAELLREDLGDIRVKKDLAGLDRVITAKKR